jgi:hypothetical protein
MSNISGRGFLVGLLLALILSPAPAVGAGEFCSDSGCTATRQLFKQLCDFIAEKKSNVPIIYTGGYYIRTLVAGYEILGEQRYLDVATAYADGLVKKQMARGYWGSGYGDVELADTGSALGLFSVLYRHVDKDRQQKYLAAVQRYVTAVESDGFIHPSGAVGFGWNLNKDGTIGGILKDDYVIATALTGGEVFIWMFHITKEDKYRRVAFNAISWMLSTMRKDGVIPFVDEAEGTFLGKQGDPKNDFRLWDENTYQASTYGGEGLIAFDLYCDQPEWKSEVQRKIRPDIEFLLRSQNSDGTWGIRRPPASTDCLGIGDPARGPGVVNLLIWYYSHVDRDPRIVNAVHKFDRFLLNPEQAKQFGLLNFGAPFVRKCSNSDTVTSLTGRALSDILDPGITARW